MKNTHFSALALLLLTPSALADLTTYTEDFEGLNAADPAALTGAGFVSFASVFDPAGNFLYQYGTFGTPNGAGGFADVAGGSGGASQGLQYINSFSDYNNVDHANGNFIQAFNFRDQTIAASDVGDTWRFTFDHLKAPTVNGDGSATTFAFVKVLQSSNGSFATLFENEFDSTAVSDMVWGQASLDITIDPTWSGELLQFGFRSYATNYDDTGRYHDNLVFEQVGGSGPTLTPYSEDFEALDIMGPSALTDAGYKIFANVFDPMGGYLYGYGVFGAPNGGAGFSAIATGDGGPTQMLQYINVYSDYNNGDHANGNYIEALVFQEQVIGAVNIGETWRMRFDYRKNATVTNGDGDSETYAFVKVIKISDSSFATLFESEFDSTDASTLAWGSSAIDILIDPTFAGELVQFGFRSYATNYNDTGRYYDNVEFAPIANPGLGTVVCLGNPNSTGADALLTITGSKVAADNNFTMDVTDLPLNAVGYFIHSKGNIIVYNPNGSEGHICIAGPGIGRFAQNILSSGMTGTVTFSPDLTNFPLPTSTEPVLAGDTRYFQYWTRDNNMGTPVSNFSSAAGVTFE